MGTRGTYGFRKNGVDKFTYNHFDSYPEYLGSQVADFCRNTSIDELNEIFDRIQLVNENSVPDEEQVKDCEKWTNLEVSTQSTTDWYCLLREAQGDLDVYKDGLNYMTDHSSFIRDSSCCQYGYIINLDTNELEYWEGYQNKPQPGNRYGVYKEDGSYPCRLIMTFPLDRIPENAVEQMNSGQRIDESVQSETLTKSDEENEEDMEV